jgi:hypothetical protein
MPLQELSRELLAGVAAQYPDLESLNLGLNEIVVIENLFLLPSLRSLSLASNR